MVLSLCNVARCICTRAWQWRKNTGFLARLGFSSRETSHGPWQLWHELHAWLHTRPTVPSLTGGASRASLWTLGLQPNLDSQVLGLLAVERGKAGSWCRGRCRGYAILWAGTRQQIRQIFTRTLLQEACRWQQLRCCLWLPLLLSHGRLQLKRC